jgi:predicted XRE-type DNA-binding protein
MRSELMVLLSRFIKASGLTQHAAAEYFGTSQPRISDLLRGRIEKFSVDLLIDMTERAGWTVGLKLKKRAA